MTTCRFTSAQQHRHAQASSVESSSSWHWTMQTTWSKPQGTCFVVETESCLIASGHCPTAASPLPMFFSFSDRRAFHFQLAENERLIWSAATHGSIYARKDPWTPASDIQAHCPCLFFVLAKLHGVIHGSPRCVLNRRPREKVD